MEEIFAALDWNEVAALIQASQANPDRQVGGNEERDPLDDLEIPEV
jgi:hypothetical protein